MECIEKFVSLNDDNAMDMRLHSTTGFSLLPFVFPPIARSSVNIAFEHFTHTSIDVRVDFDVFTQTSNMKRTFMVNLFGF